MDFTTDTDADLLGYMAMQADEPEYARAAWGEFYRRHREYLFGLTSRCYGSQLGGDEGAADLVQEAFRKVYDWAGRHGEERGSLDGFRGSSPEDVRAKVRLWLGRVAENRFKDLLRRRARQQEVELLADVAEKPSAQEMQPGSEVLGRVGEAFATLRPQDQEALRVSLPWYDARTQTFAFPPGEAEAVAATLGITVDALRQRRHRALQRLKDAMVSQPSVPARAGSQR